LERSAPSTEKGRSGPDNGRANAPLEKDQAAQEPALQAKSANGVLQAFSGSQPPPPSGINFTPPAPAANIPKPQIQRVTMGNVPPTAPGLISHEGGPGSISKEQFIQTLDDRLCTEIEPLLANTPYTSVGCPYITHWLGKLQNASPADIEGMIIRYTGLNSSAESHETYYQHIITQVKAGVAKWVATGEIENIPQGLIDAIGTIQPQEQESLENQDGPLLTKMQPGRTLQQKPEQSLNNLGEGQAMDGRTQQRMGQVFGRSFNEVRVHTGTQAVQLNQQIGSKAVTQGQNIAFNQGQYQPGSIMGDALLAHELAHVVQQEGAAGTTPLQTKPQSGGAHETEANQAGLSALGRLWGGVSGFFASLPQRAAAGLSSGVKLQACMMDREDWVESRTGELDNYDTPSATTDSVETLLEELKVLYSTKEALILGNETPQSDAVDAINDQIEAKIAALREKGVRVSTMDLLDIAAGRNTTNASEITEVDGQIIKSPAGPLYSGQRFELSLAPNFLPTNESIMTRWNFDYGGITIGLLDNTHGAGLRDIAGGDINGLTFKADEATWWVLSRTTMGYTPGTKITVHGYLYLGGSGDYALHVSKEIELQPFLPDQLDLKIANPVLVRGTHLNADITNWVPPFYEYWVDYRVSGNGVNSFIGRDVPFVKDTPFTSGYPLSSLSEGDYTLTVEVYQKNVQTMARASNTPIRTASQDFTITNPGTAASGLLNDSLAQVPASEYPTLGAVKGSVESSITALGERESQGGSTADYYQSRKEAQETRLANLNTNAAGFFNAGVLPNDVSSLAPGKYSMPVPAGLFIHSQGQLQPLTVYLNVESTGTNSWKATVLDATSKDVYTFYSSGTTAQDAIQGAFTHWSSSDNPYPKECTVTHAYTPNGFTVTNNFDTSTWGKTLWSWVEGIIAIGGLVVAGLLMIVPEPTGATKVLGAIIAAAAIGVGAVNIARNLRIGIPMSDPRNVLEGIGIVTAALGFSGAALSRIGLTTARPALFRAGNYIMLSSIAGDAGAFVFMSYEAYKQLEAIKADPTIDESQKLQRILQLMTQLVANGILTIVSNADTSTFRRSNFFRTNITGAGANVQVDAGTRLDMIDYLRRNDPDFNLSTARDLDSVGLVDTFTRTQEFLQIKQGLEQKLSSRQVEILSQAEARALANADDATLDMIRRKTPSEVKLAAQQLISGGVKGKDVYKLDATHVGANQDVAIPATNFARPGEFLPAIFSSSSGNFVLNFSNLRDGATLTHHNTGSGGDGFHFTLTVPGANPGDPSVDVAIIFSDIRNNSLAPAPVHAGDTGSGQYRIFHRPRANTVGNRNMEFGALVFVDPRLHNADPGSSTSPNMATNDMALVIRHELNEIVGIIQQSRGATKQKDVNDVVGDQAGAKAFKQNGELDATKASEHDRATAIELEENFQRIFREQELPASTRAERQARLARYEASFDELIKSMGAYDLDTVAKFNDFKKVLYDLGHTDPIFLSFVESRWFKHHYTERILPTIPAGQRFANSIFTPELMQHYIVSEPRNMLEFAEKGMRGGHHKATYDAINADPNNPFYFVLESQASYAAIGDVFRYMQYRTSLADKSSLLGNLPTATTPAPTPGTSPSPLPTSTLPTAGTHYDAANWTPAVRTIGTPTHQHIPKSAVADAEKFLKHAERAVFAQFENVMHGSLASGSPVPFADWKTIAYNKQELKFDFEGVPYMLYFTSDGAGNLKIESIFPDASRF